MTQTLRPTQSDIAKACDMLAAGGLVALPTETVYGLAGDARNGQAVARIYEAKGRPSFNPLIAHVATVAAARALGQFDARADALAAAFWPGPLTLVLPLRADAGLSSLVTAGLESVAIRVPAAPSARALLEAYGRPLAAPSANPSGRISPTTAAHVLAGLSGKIDAVIDAGPCSVGVESTIVGLAGARAEMLREGGVAREEIEAVIGPLEDPAPARPDAPTAPGQLSSHYAPGAPVRLNAETAQEGEVLLGFGGTAGAALDLSPSSDLREAAANLFAMLHALDQQAPGAIAVAPIPPHGLGAAINDRLARAAAPRA